MAIPPSARAGPSRTRPRGTAQVETDDEAEENLQKPIIEEEDGWTVETFENHPIDKSPATLLLFNGFMGKIKDIIIRAEQGNEKTKLGAVMIEDASPDDDMLEELQAEFLRGLDKIVFLDIRVKILEGLSLQLRQNQPLVNPMETYERECKKREEEYMAKTPRQKYKENTAFNEFRSAIWEVNHQELGCPPVSKWLPREDADGEDDDSDIEMGGQTQNYRCPITLKPYEKAMTCSECKHSYSKDAILGILNQTKGGRRKQTKCPLAGCNQVVTPELLFDDEVLQRRTDMFEKRRLRREAEREEEEDDE